MKISAAVRYSLAATLAASVIVGCVCGSAFLWQRLFDDSIDAGQQQAMNELLETRDYAAYGKSLDELSARRQASSISEP